jgi:hypothetical protein
MYECAPKAVFDDDNLPDGICDQIYREIEPCATNLATTWAVGGDTVTI